MTQIKDYTFLDVSKPFEKDDEVATGVVQIFKNFWFMCADGDPKRALVYKGFALQCNADERVMNHVYSQQTIDLFAKEGIEIKIVRLPMAYRKWDTSQYGN
jgi:hypothetical protein